MAEHLRPQRRAAPEAVEGVLSQPGESLDPRIRAWLEPRFEQDFSQVRVHTDHAAAESADALSSLAYAVGNHIVFNSGQYAPETLAGRRLLAHEMTHFAQ
ncbi:DUF4157 domain-containing protein [Amycolatopsis sp. NPDC004079]|uniref:eCIS core domain-containing protein n=1 Tax=Amycolatopsis sp. NPDC004079 TaxID=3154549 RepID=UPI0033B70647